MSWNWNSVDNGPHRDLVGMFVQQVHEIADYNSQQGMVFVNIIKKTTKQLSYL